jgi:hypothetical protein
MNLKPLLVRDIDFFPFLSSVSSMNFFSISSLWYSAKRWLERFEYLSKGVGFIELFLSFIILSMSRMTSSRPLFCIFELPC